MSEQSVEMSLVLKSSDQYLSSNPRIAMLPPSIKPQCESVRYGKLPLYALYKDVRPKLSDEDRQAAFDRARCKLNARFVYVEEDGTFTRCCSHHLRQKLHDPEYYSVAKWYNDWKDRLR